MSLLPYITQTKRDTLTPEAQAIEKLFHILPKIGGRQRFALNESQRDYDSIRSNRDIITKARQKGFSSLGIAYQTVDCLGKEGTRAVLISHEARATMRLLDKAHFYLKHMSVEYEYRDLTVKADLGRHSRNELYFPKTDSSFYIGTAGGKAFGRGDTISHLHISEYAYWETDALKDVAGLFQAVPATGTVRIESTGQGRNNDFFYMTRNAETLGYQRYFRSWYHDPEYQLTPPDKWEPAGFEDKFSEISETYNLTEPQLYWYWRKLLEFRMDFDYLRQEYPNCIDDCFKSTGHGVFPTLLRSPNSYWNWGKKSGYRMDFDSRHPKSDHTYVLGADAAGGTGNDPAAIEVISMTSLEQVLSFSNNTIDPVKFGYLLIELGNLFNEAYIIAEGNHHGIATHSILRSGYNLMKIYKSFISTQGKHKYGFQTSDATKPLLVGAIMQVCDLGLTLYNEETCSELNAFEEDPKTGKLSADPDGRVISLGLASVGFLKWSRFVGPPTEVVTSYQERHQSVISLLNSGKPYTIPFDEILNSLNSRSSQATQPSYLRGNYDA